MLCKVLQQSEFACNAHLLRQSSFCASLVMFEYKEIKACQKTAKQQKSSLGYLVIVVWKIVCHASCIEYKL